MNVSLQRAYKRKCFQGRGTAARWLDRLFFSALCGVCLHILSGMLALSWMLSGTVLLCLFLWDRRRWDKYKDKLLKNAVLKLRREDWLKQEAVRIRQEGGAVIIPTPNVDTLIGLCVYFGRGKVLHCIGEAREDLVTAASEWGCSLIFHPWGEGKEPSPVQVNERLKREAPEAKPRLWRKLLHLPGNRYFLAGCILLLLSVCLRKTLYWRLLGTVCLLIGTLRRSIRLFAQT